MCKFKTTVSCEKLTKILMQITHQDIMSHQHVLDSLGDKAEELSKSSNDASAKKVFDDLSREYKNLCKTSEELLSRFEMCTAEHQQYQDVHQTTVLWLESWNNKLAQCTDSTGDRYTVQNKLDRLQELQNQQKDGDNKESQVSELNAKTQVNTSAPGIEILKRELDALKSDWDSAKDEADSAQTALENALQLWKEFETSHTTLNNWLKNTEQQLKDIALRSTLEEKQEQVERLKALKSDIDAHEGEVDKFTDAGQALIESSGDTKINAQITQAVDRYHALQATIQVRCFLSVSCFTLLTPNRSVSVHLFVYRW